MDADGPRSVLCRLFSCISQSMGPVFQRLWLGMLSSLLAVLPRLADPEPKPFPGAG